MTATAGTVEPGPFDDADDIRRATEVADFVAAHGLTLPEGAEWSPEWRDGRLVDVQPVPKPGYWQRLPVGESSEVALDAAERAARLRAADEALEVEADGDPLGKFSPGEWPQIVNGVVVPALSVVNDRTISSLWWPASNIATVGYTDRAVGFTPRAGGKWCPVWVGDDEAARFKALGLFLAAVSRWEDRHR